MNNSQESNHCPECGAEIPGRASDHLCSACLLKQALVSRTLDTSTPDGPLPPPPSPEEIADKFPNYEVVECLGRGGMGVVYKARQKSLDRWVAIKVLAPERVDEERFSEHFEREAKTLAKMSHPNIVTVFDHGVADGVYYIVMEFVDGVNLRDLLREGKMEPEQALAIVPPICEALEYAHAKGVVHRDIKPENLLLDREGRVKIADFGIASLVGATGEHSGTPPYMAPEQSGGKVDRRADIYALGAVLYEMLTGERPAKDLMAPSSKVELDVKIDEMVLRALEKEPERRYQTAGEFRTVVQTMAATPGQPVQQAVSAEEARFSRTAIVGACWASFAFIALLLANIPMGPSSSPVSGRAWWQWILIFTVLPLGVTAPFGTTILGWVSVSKIHRSAGKVYGLGLAVFDGLLFPLLVFNGLILGLCFTISTVGVIEILIIGVILSLMDYWIARRVWRVVNPRSKIEPVVEDTGATRWVSILAMYLAFLSGLIPTLFYWLRPLHGSWLSNEVVDIMLWVTLVAAVLAVILGGICRRETTGRRAAIVGGISLTVWILLFVAGQLPDRNGRLTVAVAEQSKELGPQELRKLPTDQLIAYGVKHPISPWAWKELEGRPLTKREVGKIMTGLTQWVYQVQIRGGFTEPLSWVNSFLNEMSKRGLVEQEQAVELMKMIHGPLRCEPAIRVREGDETVDLVVGVANVWENRLMGMTLMTDLATVTLNGKPVEAVEYIPDWNMERRYIEVPIAGVRLGNSSIKTFAIKVFVRSSLVPTENLEGLDNRAPSSDWPPAIATWERTVDIELVVYSKNAKIVRLVNDRSLDPILNNKLRIEGPILVRRKGDGAEATLRFEYQEDLPVAFSFDVELQVGDQKVPCGSIFGTPKSEGRPIRSGVSLLSADLEALDPKLTHANVVLTPNPNRVERYAEIDTLWNSEITLIDVDLKRLDR